MLLNDRVYFSNGSRLVLYADGESSVKVAGDVPGSCRFMGVSASHLITAFTTEPAPSEIGSRNYRRRVRWSKSGDPDNWTDFSAGFIDSLDVPDQWTGISSLGRNFYLFRSNGITIGYPTGIGGAPFAFEQFSYSQRGIGNIFPYSLATHGTISTFIAYNDIYSLDGSSLEAIGGGSRQKIFNDLAVADGDRVVGFITPRLSVNFDYLSYWLSIPGAGVTWIYHFDERSWVRFASGSSRLTALSSVAIS